MKKPFVVLILAILGTFGFFGLAGPVSAQGTCSVPVTSPQPVTNNCAPGFSPYAPPTNSPSPEGPTTFECECVPSSQIPNFEKSNTTNLTFSKCNDGSQGVETALGCVKGDLGSFVNLIFNLALGLAGGLAVLFIIIGGFKVAMSQGDVDALQDGRDMITKAITGLVFILLASTILAIIGIDILGLNSVFQRGPGGSIIVK